MGILIPRANKRALQQGGVRETVAGHGVSMGRGQRSRLTQTPVADFSLTIFGNGAARSGRRKPGSRPGSLRRPSLRVARWGAMTDDFILNSA